MLTSKSSDYLRLARLDSGTRSSAAKWTSSLADVATGEALSLQQNQEQAKILRRSGSINYLSCSVQAGCSDHSDNMTRPRGTRAGDDQKVVRSSGHSSRFDNAARGSKVERSGQGDHSSGNRRASSQAAPARPSATGSSERISMRASTASGAGAATAGRSKNISANASASVERRNDSSYRGNQGRSSANQGRGNSQRDKTSNNKISKKRLPISLAVAIVFFAIVISMVSLAQPFKEWWFAHRDQQQLEAENVALQARNKQIASLTEDMQTSAGIEDRARELYNWVLPGQEAVNVVNLGISDSSTRLPASIEPGSVQPSVDWLTATIDGFFGYEYQSPQAADSDIVPGLPMDK
ncbi:MAG: septum formation initiator family protein, partial [Coriobacteriales bacterium]|nr:septum formation initiator family protein [Coriobacteriales bacterium]